MSCGTLTIVSHPEQGWSLLCNGVVIFEDTGELLPDGAFIAPQRPTDLAMHGGQGGQAPAALSSSATSRGLTRDAQSDDSSLTPSRVPSLAPGHRPQAQAKGHARRAASCRGHHDCPGGYGVDWQAGVPIGELWGPRSTCRRVRRRPAVVIPTDRGAAERRRSPNVAPR